MTILGIILLILAGALVVFKSKINDAIDITLSPWISRSLLGLGVLMVFLGSFTWYARPGYQYYIVSPGGNQTAEYNSGYHVKTPWTRIQEWEKFVDIKTVVEGEPTDGIEGVISDKDVHKKVNSKGAATGETEVHYGIPVRYNDQVRGNVQVSVRIQLPTVEEDFINMAETFRHPKNLVNNTLIPTVREQTINTAYMFSAEDYVSGEASNFRQTLDEQLKYGGFAVEKHEVHDSIYNFQDDPTKPRTIKEIQTKVTVEKKKDTKGKFIRIPHDITSNKLLVAQVIVDRVHLEPKFQKKLETQRDISAQKSIEIQKAETAADAQNRIVAEGERDKAAKRVEEEKAQVTALIKIETQLKQEETKKKLAKIALETERLEAQRKKVAADAQAYENRQLVSAGLTPLEKANIEKQTRIGIAAELAKTKWPSVYMSGSNGKGNSSMLQDLIGAEMANKMLSTKK